MKKLILSVAVLAAFASCSKNEGVSVPQGDAIGFATLNNRVTKAANTNADGENSQYQVYANVTGATTWLINEAIYGADSGQGVDPAYSADTYVSGNVYYWPSTGSVDFYAFAPTIAASSGALVYSTTVTVGATSSTIPLKFTVPTDADIDFTVATPVKSATSNTNGATSGKVSLTFSHMLAKAGLTVALDSDLAKKHTFTFTKAEFIVAKNAVTADAASTTATTSTTDATSSSATYAYTCTTTDSKTYTASNELFFAPKAASASGYSIKLSGVVIKNGENTIFSDDLTYTIADTTLFEQGKAYNFAVTINATATSLVTITFLSTESSWTPSTGGSSVPLS